MASTIPVPPQQTTQAHVDSGSANANPTWREAALIAAARLARQRERFTSCDVLEELAKPDVKTHDLRAIGGVMQEVRDLGLITSVGLIRRNDKHSRGATTLWESKLYRQSVQTTVPESR